MSAPDLSHVRNIGIVAHVDAGKTTLTERLLYYAGVSYKIGEVHDGAAHMDYLAEERAHGITIMSAITKAPWLEHTLQIIDTPGHVDFTIEVERSMRVLDGCVVVLDGVRGVEPQTETIWRQRNKFGIPSLFFINKIDRPGADFSAALASISKDLAAHPVAITVPLAEGKRIVHLIEKSILSFSGEYGETVTVNPCDAATWEKLAGHREALLFAVAEEDDRLAEQLLSGTEMSQEAIWKALRKATLSGKVQPCFGGTALHNVGIQPLMDAIVKLLASPLERPASRALSLEGGSEEVAMNPEGPLAALVFKVQLWEGRRHVFARLYRGKLTPGQEVVIPQAGGKLIRERVARVFDVDAHSRSRLEQAFAGQIVLLAGLRYATTGDTLCDPEHPLILERISTREPVLGLAIEAGSSADEEKLLDSLDKLLQEDPTLKLEEDAETGQRILRGMGELHLQIMFERLEREFGVSVRTGKPQVVKRETILRSAQAEVALNRQLQHKETQVEVQATALVKVEPLARGKGVELHCEPLVLPEGETLSAAQQEAAYSALKSLSQAGILTGAPMQDLSLSLVSISLFGASSSPLAVQMACQEALREALAKASPSLLSPIMALDVTVPNENLGAVLGDLQARQALIQSTEVSQDVVAIKADCPLEHILGYATDLRSLTQGRGQFSMKFAYFG